jgi:predicted small secreted protein
MIRKLLLAVMIASGAMLSACNTVEGVGKDVESAGDAVQDAAD